VPVGGALVALEVMYSDWESLAQSRSISGRLKRELILQPLGRVGERQRWEALRTELRAARTAYDAGDRGTALGHVDAALAIDPDFLAAHCLRDRVLAPPEPVAPTLAANLARQAPTPSALPESFVTGPPVSAAGRALFEPELVELTAEPDEVRRTAASFTPGPWIAAAAVFVTAVVGPWFLESESLISHPMVGSALQISPLVPAAITTVSTSTASTSEPEEPIDESQPGLVHPSTARPLPTVVNGAWAPVGTPPEAHLVGRDDPVVAPTSMAVAAPASVPVAAPTPMAAPAPVTATGPASVAITGQPSQLTVLPRPVQPPPAVAALALSAGIAATSVAIVNDELIIRQTLERYRNAYNGLDARSAQAVYPAVNQAALARAFDSLQSQSLAFDACEMQVGGWSATATCHGSTRYVPKIGDHALHTEPRVWSFTLSKNGDDWKIENARAEP